jgi:N-methylhydantoinase A
VTGARWFVGVDVGGTFTDVVLARADGTLHVEKVATTPDDPRTGVLEGVQRALRDAHVAPAEISRVVHGTTLATNVVLERRGGPVAFVVTQGFGDLLRLGREARVEEDRYNVFFTTPEPPVDPRGTFEVAERVAADGSVVRALGAGAADAVAARVATANPVAVAVCFVNSYANPEHEQKVADALRRALPDTFVVASSEIWPEMREYERAMTTLMCAYVGPVMAAYLTGLDAQLRSVGIDGPLEIMDSSGGVMSASLAARRPVRTLESGGAAGVTAAGMVGTLLGARDVISFDMGGTTAKLGLVRDGRPAVVSDLQLGGKGSFGATRAGTGFPVKVSTVDLAEVGAGGGSIAWLDVDGALRVGPRSAGAVPGPACYARGGTHPTVTDANLVLGYLAEGLAGGVQLSLDAARAALQREIAEPLGISDVDAARSVHDIVNANMAAAIRMVTVQRGIDPRQFALVALGGAGPIHAVHLAAEFGIRTVAVPRAAGVGSAVGLVGADLRVDLVHTCVVDVEGGEVAVLERAFEALEARGRAELADDTGAAFRVSRAADLRYRGQAHHLTIPAPDPLDLVGLAVAFRHAFAAAYGIAPDLPVQVHNVRIEVTRIVEKYAAPEQSTRDADASVASIGERAVVYPGEAEPFASTVFNRSRLQAGAQFDGPAVIAASDCTIVVPPGTQARVDAFDTIVLTDARGAPTDRSAIGQASPSMVLPPS